MKKTCLILILISFLFNITACAETGTKDTEALHSNPEETTLNTDAASPSENESEQTTSPETDTAVTVPSEPVITEPDPVPTEPEPSEPLPTEPPATEPLPTEPEPTEPPHVHDYIVTTSVDASCTSGGYAVYTCSGCGKSYQDDETEKLGHSYGEWVETARAGIDITQQRTCSRCGKVKTRETLDYPPGNYVEGPNNSSYMYQKDLDECARKIHEITQPWLEADLSEFERAEKAFLYLQDNVSYLFSSEYKTSNLVGPILHGKADCWGYSSAFQYLCHALGLECYYVIPVNTSNDMHRWNIVKIDGQYYHVDAQVGFFLMSDEEMGANEDTMKNYPACPESSPYGDYWSYW